MSTVADRVKETSTTTGTGDITLAGAATGGFVTFNAAFGIQVFFPYTIQLTASNEWEEGDGYLSASATLVRARPIIGSAGANTLVNFSAGTKDVFCSASGEFLRSPDPTAIYGVPSYLP